MRMSRILLVLPLALVLAGCGMLNQITGTQSMKPAGNGVHVRVGDLQFSSLVVVAVGDTAVVSGTIVNNGGVADQVLAAKVAGTVAYLAPAELMVGANNILRLGFGTEGNIDAKVEVEPGSAATVEILMASGKIAKAAVMVVEPTGAYSEVTAAPEPVASESAAP